MNAWISRYGVHGSARPGLSTRAVFRAIAGTQSAWTPGELLGRTTPSVGERARSTRMPARFADPAVEDRRGRGRG